MNTWLRITCGVVAAVIALLALAVTITFYSSYGTDRATQLVFIALAIVSMAVKFLAPAAAAGLPGFRLVQTALWIGFATAVIFDSFGVAGYVEMTYGSKSGEASRYADEYKAQASEVSDAHKALEVYSATRPTLEVAVELGTAERLAGNCKKREHTDDCKKVAELKLEKARADERDRLKTEWQEAKAKFDNMKKPEIAADPQAAVVARIGSRIGAEWAADFVAPIISILIFIFFEVVGPALMFAALHSPTKRIAENVGNSSAARSPAAGKRQRTSSAPATSAGVLEALRELLSGARKAPGVFARDGKLIGAQRALGAALGISAAKLNKNLGELQAAGSIAKRNVSEGTEIDFLGVF